MAKIALIYGSTTGNTQSAAQEIESALSAHEVTSIEVSEMSASTLEEYSNLILGTSTWGCGDLQDDWDCELSTLSSADLSGKTVALFGSGDSASYPDTFVDGMGTLYQAVVAAGATVVGQTSASGYSHSDSTAEVDGQFVGLALDDDTMDENSGKIEAWAGQISSLFN